VAGTARELFASTRAFERTGGSLGAAGAFSATAEFLAALDELFLRFILAGGAGGAGGSGDAVDVENPRAFLNELTMLIIYIEIISFCSV
jgi:hypothetical protein